MSESNVLLDENILTDPKIQTLLLTVLVCAPYYFLCTWTCALNPSTGGIVFEIVYWIIFCNSFMYSTRKLNKEDIFLSPSMMVFILYVLLYSEVLFLIAGNTGEIHYGWVSSADPVRVFGWGQCGVPQGLSSSVSVCHITYQHITRSHSRSISLLLFPMLKISFPWVSGWSVDVNGKIQKWGVNNCFSKIIPQVWMFKIVKGLV